MREIRNSAREPITPADHRFPAFGTGLLVLALVAVLTGIALVPFYHAAAGAAYPSVAAIQSSAPLRIVRGVHHWASALLLLLGVLYLVYGLLTSAYRRPWQVAWIAAVGLVLIFFAFQLTGHLLSWDSQAVSTAAIETGIAESAPVIGPAQARLMRGGTDTVSPQTLTAWYTAHVALLPFALAALAGLFLLSLRRAGSRWAIPRAPLVAVLAVLLLAAVAAGASLGSPGTPADYGSFTARSEWYVLPLHGLLVLAQRVRPSLGFVGSMVIPGLVVLFLVVLPWLDRAQVHHSPSSVVRGAATLGVTGVLVLVFMNLGNMEPLAGPREAPTRQTIASHPASESAPVDPALVKAGRAVFERNGCLGCHKLAGSGGAAGPPLDGEARRQPDLDWQIRHLQNPAAATKGSTMPSFKQLSDSDLKVLATYLLSLK